ncbi:MAG TPA: DNA primase [Acidobacteriota bacterium]
MTLEAYREQVRSASDILEIVGQYVALRKRGTRYLGLCPFHREKTPSFSVNPELQLFHCFGCKAGGDVFKFVERIENLDFPEALRSLAERAGLPPPPSARGAALPKGELERMRAALQAAQEYYVAQLDAPAGAPARRYLASRGLRPATISAFGIGWAPAGREDLIRHLLGRGFELAALEASGLALRGESGTAHDRFRGRIQFPIRDAGGRVVGFGGRALGEDQPKYLNSPETALFRKGSLLYGYERAREALRGGGQAILVEGYLDLIALHQVGFDAALAPLGTALTPEHARLLKRHAREVVLCFDADQAGVKATERALEILLAEGLAVRCLELPAGDDPDSFVQREGQEALRLALERARPGFDFLLAEAQRRWELGTPAGKMAALEYVTPFLARLPSELERDAVLPRLAERLGVEDRMLLGQLRQSLRSAGGRLAREELQRAFGLKLCERRLIRFLLEQRELGAPLRQRLAEMELRGLPSERLLRSLLHQLGEDPRRPLPELSARLSEEEDRELIAAIALAPEPAPDLTQAEGCLSVIQDRFDLQQLETFQRALEDPVGGGSDEDRLLSEKLAQARKLAGVSAASQRRSGK